MSVRRLLCTLLVGAGLVTGSVVASAESPQIADDAFTSGASAVELADRVRTPSSSGLPRPRVFMALHGMNQVANNSSLDSQWRFVQSNLDGIWGNNANISRDEIARLVRKVDTRQLITESAFNGSFFVEPYTYVERAHSDIDFDREAIAFYTDRPSNWNGQTIAGARNAVARTEYGGDERYREVFTGWQPQNFYTNGGDGRSPILAGSSADRAIRDADGLFVECPNDVCNGIVFEDGFFRAMRLARETDQRFIWFASRPPGSPQSGWLAEFQTMYNRITQEDLWRDGDVIVVISYFGGYPIVPESINGRPADTTMGIINWALRQN
ncbi:MAG: hypothetical protein AB8G26_08745 [Ilumatobacter sp.]